VNVANTSGSERTVAQVEKKWVDLKSTSKRAIATWNKHLEKCGGDPGTATPPTTMQWKIISIKEPYQSKPENKFSL